MKNELANIPQKEWMVYHKYELGHDIAEIARKYHLSYNETYRIIGKVRKQILYNTDYISEIDTACEQLGISQTQATKIQHTLIRKKLHIRKQWTRLKEKDILSIQGFGPKTVAVIQLAQQLYKS